MHFGPQCHWPTRPPRDIATELVRDIKGTVRSHKDLPPSFDVILLTGDFTWNSPIPEQPDALETGFETARIFVHELVKQELVRDANSIVIIPGNHDIRWSERDANGQYDFRLREDAEEPYRLFIQDALKDADEAHRNNHLQTHLGHQHVFSPPGNCDYVLLALNSARIEAAGQSGVGYVGYDQVYDLLTQLGPRRRPIRFIAALHHHVFPVESLRLRSVAVPRDGRKLSFVTDAYELLDTLLHLGTAVILHGHMHKAHHYYYGVPKAKTSGKPERVTGVSAAGSVSLGRASQNITEDHHFQVIRVFENNVEFFSFTAPLMEANKKQAWQAPERLDYVPDPFRPTTENLFAGLNYDKLRKSLKEQRIYESVLELDAWIRGDQRARGTIRDRISPKNLTPRARESFDQAFASAERRLATAAFFTQYVTLIEEDNPKLIERWVSEEMNRW